MRFFYYSTACNNANGGIQFNYGIHANQSFPTIKQIKDEAISNGANADLTVLSITELSQADAEKFISES
jgi:hypothetical protein